MKKKAIHQSFSIAYTYEVIFTSQMFSIENKTLAALLKKNANEKSQKVAFVIDQGCLKYHKDLPEQIQTYFQHYALPLCTPFLTVSGGEEVKNTMDATFEVLKQINTSKIDRHSYLVAIGGGAVLDMAGFAAAIGHRGIRHIRIPTTVLSQNDSGIGVKNGINFFEKKNFVGSFSPPFAVINDSHFLTTLEDRDWRSGIAEAIKVALIKDAPFFDWICKNSTLLNKRDLPAMETLVRQCAHLHAMHISNSGDPFEQGSSRPLDFGHWAAHKLEQLTAHQIRHGEAVAIGIALDVTYAYSIGLIPHETYRKILLCLLELGFDITHSALFDEKTKRINNAVWEGLEEFREHLGGVLTITLIKAIGEGVEVHEIDRAILDKSVVKLDEEYNTYENTKP